MLTISHKILNEFLISLTGAYLVFLNSEIFKIILNCNYSVLNFHFFIQYWIHVFSLCNFSYWYIFNFLNFENKHDFLSTYTIFTIITCTVCQSVHNKNCKLSSVISWLFLVSCFLFWKLQKMPINFFFCVFSGFYNNIHRFAELFLGVALQIKVL